MLSPLREADGDWQPAGRPPLLLRRSRNFSFRMPEVGKQGMGIEHARSRSASYSDSGRDGGERKEKRTRAATQRMMTPAFCPVN